MMKWPAIIVIAAALLLCCGCTPTRNTAATRNYQAFITRYNIHYNGDKHYRETLEDMERDYRDDFSRILFVHPAEARGVAGVEQPTGDFTRSIEKAQKAIQLRSIKRRPAGPSATPAQREWKRRSEYNPFLHNSWLMLGRAQYMNGDFSDAADTFLYISRHFRWMPEVVAEAHAWEALCCCALDRLYEAETILAKVPREMHEQKELRRIYLYAAASLMLRRKNYAAASEALTELIGLSHGKQKTRLRFLLGQALQRSGNDREAYQVFRNIENSLTTDYAIRFNARMAMSAVTPAAETDKEIRSLEKLTHYSSNAAYLDQIYYAEGNLYLAQKDTASAMKFYSLAIEKSVRHGYDQAQSRLALGALLYDRGIYDMARDCYNAALPVLPSDFPDIESITRRALALDEAGIYAENIRLQDSLLHLSGLSRDKQIEISRRLANEYRPNVSSQQHRITPTAAFAGKSPEHTWYFYNPALVAAGRDQFRKIWGDRLLTDDWRNNSKKRQSQPDAGFIHEPPVSTPATENRQPDSPEYYLTTIPDTPEKIRQAENIVAESLFHLGMILRDRLDDYTAAERIWNELLRRYPETVNKFEVAEGLYLIYARKNDGENAEKMRQIILTDFPDTELAADMARPDYLERKKMSLMSQDSLYSRAYTAYLDNDNATVHELHDYADKNISPEILLKLSFLNALAHGSEGNEARFRDEMKKIAANGNDRPITKLAEEMLSQMEAGRQPGAGSSENVRPMIRPIQLHDTASAHREYSPAPIKTDTVFKLDPDTPHTLLLAFDSDSVSPNALLYEVARYNFNTYAVRDFGLRPMTVGETAILAITGFSSLREAEQYLSRLYRATPQIISADIHPVVISDADMKSLLTHSLTIDQYIDAAETSRFISARTKVLPPDTYEIEAVEAYQ